jgi:hypothetical protein
MGLVGIRFQGEYFRTVHVEERCPDAGWWGSTGDD